MNIINTDAHPASEVGADNTVTLRAPAQTHFLEADGIRFAYRIMGPDGGVPLLFCQRFRGTMDEWDPAFLEALAPNRRLVIFDNIGISSTSGTVPTVGREDVWQKTGSKHSNVLDRSLWCRKISGEISNRSS